MTKVRFVVLAASAVTLSATVAGAQNVPPGQMPPAGLCRIWIDGVPAGRQPHSTDCATARRNAPANAHVLYGGDVRHTVNGQYDARRDPRSPSYDARYDPNSRAYDPRYGQNTTTGTYDPRYGTNNGTVNDPRYGRNGTTNNGTYDPRYSRNGTTNGTYDPRHSTTSDGTYDSHMSQKDREKWERKHEKEREKADRKNHKDHDKDHDGDQGDR